MYKALKVFCIVMAVMLVVLAERLLDKSFNVLGIGELIKEENKQIDKKWRR